MLKAEDHVSWELRASGRAASGALVLVALAIYWIADAVGSGLPRRTLFNLVLVICAAAAVGLILENWKPLIGRSVIVFSLIALPVIGAAWLSLPPLVVLLAIAAPFAATAIGLRAAAAAAVASSAVLALLPTVAVQAVDASVSGVTAALVWALTGLMVLAYRPVYLHVRWISGFLERAQQSVDDARERKADLEQSTVDLANANRQLALANERVVALRHIAEDAEKAKTAFVSKVSHEFRTPLNMIIGLVDLMAEHPEIYAFEPSPKMEEAMEVVLRNCRHLAALVDDVLDLTRVEAGRLTLHREHVDLVRVVQEAVDAVRPLTDSKSLVLRLDAPAGLPTVYCDETRIRQVVLNLVSNAARFTDQGSITIAVRSVDGRIKIAVSDTGPGVPQQEVERIFEPFYQGSGLAVRGRGGSGLGLSISHQFVRLHGGRMWVESIVGSGSTFFFELPVAPLAAATARPGHWIREDWVWREGSFRTDGGSRPPAPLRPRLVVHDQTGALYSEMARYRDEIDLVPAASVAEAVAQAEHHASAAIMINTPTPAPLPHLVAQVARESPSTPVVGSSIPAVTEAALAAGASGYLVKPVARLDLEGILSSTGRQARRVLVVDDDPEAAELFHQMLRATDPALEIEEAFGGQEAIDQLLVKPFDLVLLDIAMPDLNGWQVLDRMRELGFLTSTQVHFITAQDPADRPPLTPVMTLALGDGLSVPTLMQGTLELARLLLTPDEGPAPGRQPG